MLPAGSIKMPAGLFSSALVAAPPSPENPAVPVPAIVVIIPVATVIFLILLLDWSAKYTSPEGTTHTPTGVFTVAAVASPPSPVNDAVPVPARVLMIPNCAFVELIPTKNSIRKTQKRFTFFIRRGV